MIYQSNMLKKKVNIGIIGLGQVGSRLYKEILSNKKDIELKTGKQVNILAISAKNFKKKRKISDKGPDREPEPPILDQEMRSSMLQRHEELLRINVV